MSIKATAIATGLTAKPETIERHVVKYKNLIHFSWVLSAERMGTHAVVIDVDPDILPVMKDDDIRFQVRGDRSMVFLVTVVNQMGFANAQTYRFTIATTAFGALLGIFGLPLLNQLLDRFRRPAADTSGDASKQ